MPPAEGFSRKREEHAQRNKHGDIQQRIQPGLECKRIPRLPERQKRVELKSHLHTVHAIHKGDRCQSAQITKQEQNSHGLSFGKLLSISAVFPVQQEKE